LLVIAIIGVVLVLAVPSIRDVLTGGTLKKLRAINSLEELRGEAVRISWIISSASICQCRLLGYRSDMTPENKMK